MTISQEQKLQDLVDEHASMLAETENDMVGKYMGHCADPWTDDSFYDNISQQFYNTDIHFIYCASDIIAPKLKNVAKGPGYADSILECLLNDYDSENDDDYNKRYEFILDSVKNKLKKR